MFASYRKGGDSMPQTNVLVSRKLVWLEEGPPVDEKDALQRRGGGEARAMQLEKGSPVRPAPLAALSD